MYTASDFERSVAFHQLIAAFRATKGVEVEGFLAEDTVAGTSEQMIKIKSGDRIDVIHVEPEITKGRAHRLARAHGVSLAKLYGLEPLDEIWN